MPCYKYCFSHFLLFFRLNDSITVSDTIDKAQDKLFDYAFNLDFENQSISEDFPVQYSSNPVFSEEVGQSKTGNESEHQIASDEKNEVSVCYAHYSG